MRFFTILQNVPIYNLWSKIFCNYQIFVLTPFCNQKLYFSLFFWTFYTQILTKKPKMQIISKTMRFFTNVQNVSIYNLGSKLFLNISDFVFVTFFNQKQYLRVFWPFYTQTLTKKKPEFKKYRNLWGLLQKYKLQNVSIYNFGSKNRIIIFRFYDHFSYLKAVTHLSQ